MTARRIVASGAVSSSVTLRPWPTTPSSFSAGFVERPGAAHQDVGVVGDEPLGHPRVALVEGRHAEVAELVRRDPVAVVRAVLRLAADREDDGAAASALRLAERDGLARRD